MKVILAALCTFLFAGSNAIAWDGEDSETGEAVEIEEGNLVRPGRDIQIYDHGAGEYRDVTVEGIRRYGSTVEVEIYDNDSGEYRTLEMEDE